jgi:hypothetical protein
MDAMGEVIGGIDEVKRRVSGAPYSRAFGKTALITVGGITELKATVVEVSTAVDGSAYSATLDIEEAAVGATARLSEVVGDDSHRQPALEDAFGNLQIMGEKAAQAKLSFEVASDALADILIHLTGLEEALGKYAGICTIIEEQLGSSSQAAVAAIGHLGEYQQHVTRPEL